MADRVLLLGAAGTVGSRVAVALLEAGYALRCLGRAHGHRNLALPARMGAEIIQGDMNDEAAFGRALEGCRFFVHSAAPFPRSGLRFRLKGYLASWVPPLVRQFELAAKAGVERCVFTSSLSCIGLARPGEAATEDLPWDPVRQSGGNYYPVKAAMERAVLESHAQGRTPALVVVNPTGLVGEGSRTVELSGACVFYQGLAPMMVDAPMNFVDSRDVGRGHVLALQKGRPGERYILGGWNCRLSEFAQLAAGLAGRKRPPIIPRWIVHVSAWLAEWFKVFGTPGALSLTSYYHLHYGQHYSSEKARRELGYEPATDLTDAIRRELAWHGVSLPNQPSGA